MQESKVQQEWNQTIRTLRTKNRMFKEFPWFLRLGGVRGNDHYFRNAAIEVLVVGHCFPEEILKAMELRYLYLNEGSFAHAGQAEQIVPRDTDSYIKSVLGIITDPENGFSEKTVLLLPLVSDSMRKLKDLLAGKVKILSIELPNDREDKLQREHWKAEVHRVSRALALQFHRRLSKKKLETACADSLRAGRVYEKFERICRSSSIKPTGSACLWIACSYAWCSDKYDWAVHLLRLMKEILALNAAGKTREKKPQILLLGSAIYAPNYKVLLLIEEMGMEISGIVHPEIARLKQKIRQGAGKRQLLDKLAAAYLKQDMSPAFVENTRMETLSFELLRENQVHGIVVHILKGQIEYDFELNRMEEMFAGAEIPMFRLETDYHYQDVEQVRIRLEAFAEMLCHREQIPMEAGNVKKAV